MGLGLPSSRDLGTIKALETREARHAQVRDGPVLSKLAFGEKGGGGRNGVRRLQSHTALLHEVPAFAGMTAAPSPFTLSAAARGRQLRASRSTCYRGWMKEERSLYDSADARAEAAADARAEAAIREGRLIGHEAVKKWLRSWGSRNPLPRPRPGD